MILSVCICLVYLCTVVDVHRGLKEKKNEIKHSLKITMGVYGLWLRYYEGLPLKYDIL